MILLHFRIILLYRQRLWCAKILKIEMLLVAMSSRLILLAIVSPKCFFTTMSLINSFSFIMNTRSTISGRSAGFRPPPASSSMYWISGHFALHVNVQVWISSPTAYCKSVLQVLCLVSSASCIR